MSSISKQTVLTGVKPTHIPHIGNYIGAIRPSIQLSNQSENSFLFIADYHALNSVQDGKELNEFTYQTAATWLACGLDPKKTVIYKQSDIPELFELSWILSTITPKGLMNRAHAYKARVQENEQAAREDLDFGVNMGLFSYPILMAADILLFNADIVPVGEDQVQHLEITRDIAQKFNRVFGETFKLPKPHVQIPELVEGLDGRKMSKSYDNHIPLFLESKKLRKLVMKIVTDSQPPEVPKDPKTSNLFKLYKHFASPSQITELEKLYREGVGWGEVKQRLFESIEKYFSEHNKVYLEYVNNKPEIDRILNSGAERARSHIAPIYQKIRKNVRGI